MGANLSTATILFVALIYANRHKGADLPGIILGVCFGALAARSAAGPLIGALTDLIVGVFQAVIDLLNQKFGGGGGGGGRGGGATQSAGLLFHSITTPLIGR